MLESPHSSATSPDQQPRFKGRLVGSLPRATIVHHVTAAHEIYVTEGRTIAVWHAGERRVIGKFPWVSPRDWFGFCRLSQRAARADRCNVFMTSAEKVLGIRNATVYRIEEKRAMPLWQIQGDTVLHRGICEHEGQVYFGEYFRNSARGAVRLWRVDPELKHWEVAQEFPAGLYRHIHVVISDPFDSCALWVAVGDDDGECFLLRSTDGFRTYERFGAGTQLWRAVTLFFTPTHVCWITDSNLQQNYACRMDRQTQQLEQGQTVSAPGWYGCTTCEGLHVAFTTVETGPGVQTDRAGIYVSRDAFHWQPVLDFAKDRYRPVKLFKYGVINCASGLKFGSRVVSLGRRSRWLRWRDSASCHSTAGGHLRMLQRLAKWLLPPAIRWLDDSIPAEELAQFLTAKLNAVLPVSTWNDPHDQALIVRLRDQFGGPVPLAPITDSTSVQAALAAAHSWLQATAPRQIVERGVLVAGSADHLRVLLNSELDQPTLAWLLEQCERLLRHVETRRQESLQKFTPALDKLAACQERHAVTRLFLQIARVRDDLRFLNAALKLNDWAYRAHRRLPADDSRLLRYLGNLVEQQALLNALEV
jgi:hypothetical protein